MTVVEDRIAAGDLPSVVESPTTNSLHVANDGEDAVGETQAAQQLRLMTAARRNNLVITSLIAGVSFVLSFVSLSALAATTAFPSRIPLLFGLSFHLAWLWPLIVDGLIILCTQGIVALSPYPDQVNNRRYYWAVLVVSALVSVVGNGFHAWLITEHLPTWMRCGSVAVACVPPAALLAATHSLAIQWRFNPTPPPDTASRVRDGALVLAAQQMDKWDAAAVKMQEEGYCTNVATTKLAHALRYLFDHRPKMSLRAVGSQPEVDLHHDTVGKIRDAANAVLTPTNADGI